MFMCFAKMQMSNVRFSFFNHHDRLLSYMFSELILFNVHVEASGEWECVVSTGRGNVSRAVEIVVLENSASFCPEDKVVNNRGEFR